MGGAQSPDAGVTFSKAEGFSAHASGEVVETLVHGWEFTLQWVGVHPVLTFILVGSLLVVYAMHLRASIEKHRMKQDYKERRLLASRQAQQEMLPFTTGLDQGGSE